jgi:hypothetical protein
VSHDTITMVGCVDCLGTGKEPEAANQSAPVPAPDLLEVFVGTLANEVIRFGPDWECSGCGAIGAGAIAKHVSYEVRVVNACHHCVCEMEIAAVDALRESKRLELAANAAARVVAAETDRRIAKNGELKGSDLIEIRAIGDAEYRRVSEAKEPKP